MAEPGKNIRQIIESVSGPRTWDQPPAGTTPPITRARAGARSGSYLDVIESALRNPAAMIGGVQQDSDVVRILVEFVRSEDPVKLDAARRIYGALPDEAKQDLNLRIISQMQDVQNTIGLDGVGDYSPSANSLIGVLNGRPLDQAALDAISGVVDVENMSVLYPGGKVRPDASVVRQAPSDRMPLSVAQESAGGLFVDGLSRQLEDQGLRPGTRQFSTALDRLLRQVAPQRVAKQPETRPGFRVGPPAVITQPAGLNMAPPAPSAAQMEQLRQAFPAFYDQQRQAYRDSLVAQLDQADQRVAERGRGQDIEGGNATPPRDSKNKGKSLAKPTRDELRQQAIKEFSANGLPKSKKNPEGIFDLKSSDSAVASQSRSAVAKFVADGLKKKFPQGATAAGRDSLLAGIEEQVSRRFPEVSTMSADQIDQKIGEILDERYRTNMSRSTTRVPQATMDGSRLPYGDKERIASQQEWESGQGGRVVRDAFGEFDGPSRSTQTSRSAADQWEQSEFQSLADNLFTTLGYNPNRPTEDVRSLGRIDPSNSPQNIRTGAPASRRELDELRVDDDSPAFDESGDDGFSRAEVAETSTGFSGLNQPKGKKQRSPGPGNYDRRAENSFAQLYKKFLRSLPGSENSSAQLAPREFGYSDPALLANDIINWANSVPGQALIPANMVDQARERLESVIRSTMGDDLRGTPGRRVLKIGVEGEAAAGATKAPSASGPEELKARLAKIREAGQSVTEGTDAPIPQPEPDINEAFAGLPEEVDSLPGRMAIPFPGPKFNSATDIPGGAKRNVLVDEQGQIIPPLPQRPSPPPPSINPRSKKGQELGLPIPEFGSDPSEFDELVNAAAGEAAPVPPKVRPTQVGTPEPNAVSAGGLTDAQRQANDELAGLSAASSEEIVEDPLAQPTQAQAAAPAPATRAPAASAATDDPMQARVAEAKKHAANLASGNTNDPRYRAAVKFFDDIREARAKVGSMQGPEHEEIAKWIDENILSLIPNRTSPPTQKATATSTPVPTQSRTAGTSTSDINTSNDQSAVGTTTPDPQPTPAPVGFDRPMDGGVGLDSRDGADFTYPTAGVLDREQASGASEGLDAWLGPYLADMLRNPMMVRRFRQGVADDIVRGRPIQGRPDLAPTGMGSGLFDESRAGATFSPSDESMPEFAPARSQDPAAVKKDAEVSASNADAKKATSDAKSDEATQTQTQQAVVQEANSAATQSQGRTGPTVGAAIAGGARAVGNAVMHPVGTGAKLGWRATKAALGAAYPAAFWGGAAYLGYPLYRDMIPEGWRDDTDAVYQKAGETAQGFKDSLVESLTSSSSPAPAARPSGGPPEGPAVYGSSGPAGIPAPGAQPAGGPIPVPVGINIPGVTDYQAIYEDPDVSRIRALRGPVRPWSLRMNTPTPFVGE